MLFSIKHSFLQVFNLSKISAMRYLTFVCPSLEYAAYHNNKVKKLESAVKDMNDFSCYSYDVTPLLANSSMASQNI